MTIQHVRDNGFWAEVERRGYSLRGFARLIGYGVPSLSRMKRGVVPMTYRFALIASTVLGGSPDDFFSPVVLPDGSDSQRNGNERAA